MVETMRAAVFSEFGDPDVLRLAERPRPTPGRGEVRIRVGATFVAFGRDISTRSGKHPVFRDLVTLPHVLGGEHAGVVDALGAGVATELHGRRVAARATVACTSCPACRRDEPWDCQARTAIGIQRPGAYAEYTVVPAANLDVIPESLTFGQAAVLAASGPLAWEELETARARAREWVLVPGASGSVGMLTVSLAQRFGARVIALTRAGKAVAELRALGADAVLDCDDHDLAQQVAACSPHGVDVVVDNVMAPELWARYWPAVARRGRIVTAGQASGAGRGLPIDVVSFYNRRATLSGLVIGDPRPASRFWADMRRDPLVVPDALIESFPLDRAADAHRRVESGGRIGHVVLTVP